MQPQDFREAIEGVKEHMTIDGMAMVLCEELSAAQVRDLIAGLYKYVKADQDEVI